MTAIHDLDRPVPYSLTPEAHAVLGTEPAADSEGTCRDQEAREAYCDATWRETVTAMAGAFGPGPVETVPSTGFPPIVCLCGSTRFCDEFRRASLRLTLAGQIVLSIGCDTKSGEDLTAAGSGAGPAAVKARLDDLHKRKIDLADYVLVLNVGGYIGESTRSEITYARAAGKPVRYLDPAAVGEPGPGGEWACEICGSGWFSTRPDDGLCPDCRRGGDHGPGGAA